RGHQVSINRDEFANRGNKQFLGDFRKGEPSRRCIESMCVLFRPERHDCTAVMSVGFEPFKDLLPVMKHARCWIDRDRPVRENFGLTPTTFERPHDGDHVVGEVVTETWVCENCFALCRSET